MKLYQKYSKQNSNLKNSKTPSKIISKYSLTAENWTKKRNSKYNNIKSKYMDGINKINKSKVQKNEENRKLFLTPEPHIIKKKKIKDKLNISRFNLNKIDKQSGRNINNIKTQKNLKKERMVSDIDLGKDEIKFVLKELQKKKEKKPNDSEEEEEESENEDKNSNNENQSFNKNSNSSTEKNKEKTYKAANKEIMLKFSNYINSSDGNKIIASIASFLDRKTKYNFFSCSKQLINNLILELNNIYNHILVMNKIKSIDLIEEEINNINNKFKDKDLDSFKLSKGSLKALEILNGENYRNIFKMEELNPPLDEIILIYRIFFQLINKEEFTEIIGDKKFWKEARNYFLENSNGKIGSFINELISEFDFTKVNIYKLKILSNGKEDKLKPKIYENICKTTGLVTFVIKEAFEYCGIIFNEKKLMPSVLISYLEYIKENLNECKEYVNFLVTLK